MTKPTVRVVAGLLVENGKLFIARRAAHDSNGGLWEFPGGKIEDGETPEQALERELFEELSLRVAVESLYDQTTFEASKAIFEIYLFNCRRLSGTIFLVDHSEFAWIDVRQIPNYKFLPGDKSFVDRLMSEGLPIL